MLPEIFCDERRSLVDGYRWPPRCACVKRVVCAQLPLRTAKVDSICASSQKHRGSTFIFDVARSSHYITSCQVRQYAAYALVKVGQNSDVRKQVTDEGGLEPVLYLARTEEPEIQRETLACLCSLSFSEENKINITKYGGLPPVMSAIKSPDVQTARMACCACANLCEMVENMDNIVDAGGIPALVQVCAYVVVRCCNICLDAYSCQWHWDLFFVSTASVSHRAHGRIDIYNLAQGLSIIRLKHGRCRLQEGLTGSNADSPGYLFSAVQYFHAPLADALTQSQINRPALNHRQHNTLHLDGPGTRIFIRAGFERGRAGSWKSGGEFGARRCNFERRGIEHIHGADTIGRPSRAENGGDGSLQPQL